MSLRPWSTAFLQQFYNVRCATNPTVHFWHVQTNDWGSQLSDQTYAPADITAISLDHPLPLLLHAGCQLRETVSRRLTSLTSQDIIWTIDWTHLPQLLQLINVIWTEQVQVQMTMPADEVRLATFPCHFCHATFSSLPNLHRHQTHVHGHTQLRSHMAASFAVEDYHNVHTVMNPSHLGGFFPRASERRVLPIVGVCKTSSHLHIFSSSHLLIFTSSYPHIFSSSLIFSSSHLLTSSHLHTFSSSHLLIFTSSHLHIFSSSHLLILTSSPHPSSSHLHIFSHLLTSSHLRIFSSSHLSHHLHLTSSHIFSHLLTSSHIFSHLSHTSTHIFSHLLTSSHIFSHLLTSSHIFSHLLTSSHIFSHLLTSSSSSHLLISHLLLLPSCPLLPFLFLFEGGAGAVPPRRHETPTLSHEMRVDSSKTEEKLRFYCGRSNPFTRNEGRSSKLRKNCDFTCAGATLSHEMRVDRQKLRKNCDFTCAGATLSHEMRVDRQKLRKIAILLVPEQPFRTK